MQETRKEYAIGNSKIIIDRQAISDKRLELIYDKINQLFKDDEMYERSTTNEDGRITESIRRKNRHF